MSFESFQTYLEDIQPALKAWGERIVTEVKSALERELGEKRFSSFLKIESTPRAKTIESAIGKLARKRYADPAQEMTDLVGARFVVLIRDDLELVSRVILNSTLWSASLDKDFYEEIENAPTLFDYQSIHYVLRANGDINCGEVVVPDKTACEIQIRTLLQHAYAEIVHDNIYKPSGVVPKKSERLVARSMALMETTDDLFCQTIEELKKANQLRNSWSDYLTGLYSITFADVATEPDIDLNYSILDAYRSLYQELDQQDLNSFISSRAFITTRIRERRGTLFLFRQPTVLILYYLVANAAHEVDRNWPFESLREELNFIFSDLGIALSNSIN